MVYMANNQSNSPTDGAAQAGATTPEESAAAQQLAQAEERIAAAQAKMHEATQAAARLQGQLDALAQAQQQSTQVDPLDDEDYAEKLRNDPVEAARFARQENERLRHEFADAFVRQNEDFKRAIAARDPLRVQHEGRIQELKQNPAFDGWGEDQLLAVAQHEATVVSPQTKVVPGAPGGGDNVNTSRSSDSGDPIKDNPVLRATLSRMLGYDKYAEEEGEE